MSPQPLTAEALEAHNFRYAVQSALQSYEKQVTQWKECGSSKTDIVTIRCDGCKHRFQAPEIMKMNLLCPSCMCHEADSLMNTRMKNSRDENDYSPWHSTCPCKRPLRSFVLGTCTSPCLNDPYLRAEGYDRLIAKYHKALSLLEDSRYQLYCFLSFQPLPERHEKYLSSGNESFIEKQWPGLPDSVNMEATEISRDDYQFMQRALRNVIGELYTLEQMKFKAISQTFMRHFPKELQRSFGNDALVPSPLLNHRDMALSIWTRSRNEGDWWCSAKNKYLSPPDSFREYCDREHPEPTENWYFEIWRRYKDFEGSQDVAQGRVPLLLVTNGGSQTSEEVTLPSKRTKRPRKRQRLPSQTTTITRMILDIL
ncbi:uncharacterized protein EV420DRAFT_560146 [Desarmillaria tabescens]|uniref:Uncharacterized protein n=1 Tax=Armillaria tabescens TaxID=1929756 RepID=A0AA39N396_ARMTA|nr:uncharacterized protein EV420DRAFT_560146 [Desarmillaria tabescens]KAK0455794.1 hypothetical protein EV420DRAFT_560146 [Desarmillaria tabescens]